MCQDIGFLRFNFSFQSGTKGLEPADLGYTARVSDEFVWREMSEIYFEKDGIVSVYLVKVFPSRSCLPMRHSSTIISLRNEML